jgi:mono/diheme cytochrome c family protein
MTTKRTKLPSLLATLATSALALGCTAPGGPDRITNGFFVSPDAGVQTAPDVGTIPEMTPIVCGPTGSGEMYPARTTITTGAPVAATPPTYDTSDLFNLFKSDCGSCHVEASLGNPPFSVSASNFTMTVGQNVLDAITSTDPNMYMPPSSSPNGMLFTKRPPTDPIVQLYDLLSLWVQQGRPADVFLLPAPEGMQTATASYVMTPQLGSSLSNIGSCIPDRRAIAKDTSEMDALDAMFAAATETTLPATLDTTDLTTLDSDALAKTGVISYAPTYPLWTDDAGKMRYVRVPRGQSIRFDKANQRFDIPPNTRFYKTFLKAVVDANGNSTWRKIETRMIVSRPDTTNPDGSAEQNALYRTYLWNEDESQATLLDDPLRDGEPFADRIFTYITDEKKAQAIADTAPANLGNALSQAGVTRHYAVPGGERCVQCHEGSPSESFVLGFTPLQIARRPAGAGGIYQDPPTGEELTQLQRLVDYGVITGITNVATDVLPLEQSEGTRAPRTPEELDAQAYMVGNCAHCHNPRGLPSVKQPDLKDVLIFLPGSGPNEGIFQFPLDTMSPIRKRGLYQDIDLAYITPSLYDLPRDETIAKSFCPDQPNGGCFYDLAMWSNPDPGVIPPAPPTREWILAPWRSLIYRNVDTPYDYFDDSTLFPHMPLNSPGYDCRTAKIMGDWMVSIPAVLKDPTKPEDAIPNFDGEFGTTVNLDPQPYREVTMADDGYDAASEAAQQRLDAYHKSYRYNFCPNTYTDDIIDPLIQADADANLPIRIDVGQFTDPTDPSKLMMPILAPIRPHYVTFDDTDPPGDWFPRRADWADALVNPDISSFVAADAVSDSLTSDQVEDLTNVLEALESVSLADTASLLQEIPFGLWDTSVSGCNFTGVPTAGSFTGTARPAWMNIANPPATAPVYTESAGAAIFTTICFNCHGPNADSKGLLSDEITMLTGGDARVADFRDGLFGPVATPGTNRARVFGPAATTLGGGLTADDLSARYLAWMALGGTSKHIPPDILTVVSQTPVLGTVRANLVPQGTPDMLRLGLQLCAQIATSDPNIQSLPVSDLVALGRFQWGKDTGLIDVNGDAELWLRLCSMGNRPIVRVPAVNTANANGRWVSSTQIGDVSINGFNLYWGDAYGANPVMDRSGVIHTGIGPDVDFPICIPKPTTAGELAIAQAILQANKIHAGDGAGNVIPFCPDGLVTPANKLVTVNTGGGITDFQDGRAWAARGAINAALAVFLYLDEIERDPTKRKPLYNQCDLLTP